MEGGAARDFSQMQSVLATDCGSTTTSYSVSNVLAEAGLPSILR